MSFEDRLALVATVQETYALMGRSLSTPIPDQIVERAVRPDTLQQLIEAPLEPYVTDTEMLELLRAAYYELLERIFILEAELLGEDGERHERRLLDAGLTDTGAAVKITGFRSALQRVIGAFGHRAVRKAFQWADVILGSLGSIPAIGLATDAVKEIKESIETQADEDQGG